MAKSHLPGMEPPVIPEIDTAADRVKSLCKKRMNIQQDEITARDTLMRLMKEHKLKSYEYDFNVVVIEHGEPRVKVRSKKPESNGDTKEDE